MSLMEYATPLDLSGIDFALKVCEEWKPADGSNAVSRGVAFRAVLLRWGFVACLPKGLPAAGFLSWRYESEVVGSALPGTDESATVGGPVILQTHG